jgi:hypothetical protein
LPFGFGVESIRTSVALTRLVESTRLGTGVWEGITTISVGATETIDNAGVGVCIASGVNVGSSEGVSGIVVPGGVELAIKGEDMISWTSPDAMKVFQASDS